MVDAEEIELRTAHSVLPDPCADASSASPVDPQGIAADRPLPPPITVEQLPRHSLQTQSIGPLTWPSPQWKTVQDLDGLEQHLQSRSATDPASKRVIHSYTRLKDRPSGKLFNSLLTFCPAFLIRYLWKSLAILTQITSSTDHKEPMTCSKPAT
jgi:hypothetical protein